MERLNLIKFSSYTRQFLVDEMLLKLLPALSMTYQQSLGNRLHRCDQSGEVASTKEQLIMKRICEAERKRRQWATSRFLDVDLLYLQPTV